MSITGHNPCFSRIAFAILFIGELKMIKISHNPCFSRIAFAIYPRKFLPEGYYESQSLF